MKQIHKEALDSEITQILTDSGLNNPSTLSTYRGIIDAYRVNVGDQCLSVIIGEARQAHANLTNEDGELAPNLFDILQSKMGPVPYNSHSRGGVEQRYLGATR